MTLPTDPGKEVIEVPRGENRPFVEQYHRCTYIFLHTGKSGKIYSKS